jgi:hypothetical protein
MILVIALCALAVAQAAPMSPANRPWMNENDSPKTRASKLLAEMTLGEKLAMLHGPPTGPCCQCKGNASCAYVGNVAGSKRLGIPPLNLNDGPQGFRDAQSPGRSSATPPQSSCEGVSCQIPQNAFAWSSLPHHFGQCNSNHPHLI